MLAVAPGFACDRSNVRGQALDMQAPLVGALIASVLVSACDDKTGTPAKAQPTETRATPAKAQPTETRAVPLVDLTTASSLAAARTAFNAHKGEARFLTLLSPT
jgi:hypothetical protein